MIGVTRRCVGPFEENCYLLSDAASAECVLVDPGDNPESIAEMVRESGCELQAIWITHGHVDHVGAIASIRRTWEVPVLLHKLDLPLYLAAERQAALCGIPFEQPPEPDAWIADGDSLQLGSYTWTVHHVPGHSPGHVAFMSEQRLLSGDLIFRGSIGRTDLPLSEPEKMARSLNWVTGLDPHILVYPGHGPATTIAQELAANPFLNGSAKVLHG